MGTGRFALLGGLAVALVLAASVAAVGAASGPVPGPAQQTIDADTVSLRVGLAPDGGATWQVTYRIELQDDNATAAFEDLRSDIEADPGPYVDRFASRMRRAMWTAENATGRDMSLSNVSVAARVESLPQGEYGVVVYRLDWANFGVVSGETVRAGDAIDEFFLDAQTSLTVAWPEDYGLVSHTPEATTVEDGSVTWQGRRDFGPGEPRVEVQPGAPGGETAGGGGVPWLPLALVLLVVLGAATWLYARREGGGSAESPDGGPAASGAAEASGEVGDGEDAGPPAELLSNEERVLRLLEQHGGRIKQQQVAGELDWTDAKTSQVVSDLRDAGEVESFRLGRENVLTLPDVSIEPGADEDESDAEGQDE